MTLRPTVDFLLHDWLHVETLQQREIAGAGAAEAEIRADPDFARVQAAGQQAGIAGATQQENMCHG